MTSVRPGSLPAQLIQDLGRNIATGAYAPGEMLPTEHELSEHHGVSRSVVREAVKVLDAKGMVHSRPRNGTSIRPRQEWNPLDVEILKWRKHDAKFFKDLAELRLIVEPPASELAAQRANRKQIARMEAACDRMGEAKRKADTREFDAADVELHTLLIETSGNELLIQLYKVLNPLISINRKATAYIITETRKNPLKLHCDLVAAIRARDARNARRFMEKIILKARDYVLASSPSK